jgi:hypothetical protein
LKNDYGNFVGCVVGFVSEKVFGVVAEGLATTEGRG